ncbi:TonB-dependent receptor family protein [Luteimonas salinilitoris]|uniref:TonB-dependent receptor family protein n=1 Tax=Luteimonas salinilitoris TaxID=3237697 RepID=A0ABV4HV64_9GAMM
MIRIPGPSLASALAIACAASPLPLFAQGQPAVESDRSDEVTTLDEVVVHGQTLTSRNVRKAQAELARVPGGVDLVDLEDLNGQVVRNLQDVLAFTPGVFAQSQTGADQTRLSIRGSGIAETVTLRGVAVLRDGLPLTQTNGQFRSALLDPATAGYVEVYRGANALAYGASTLGGAINLISPTGHTTPGVEMHMLLGEHSTVRPRVSASFAGDDRDGYATLSGAFQDGFREHLEQRDMRFYGNLGWRHGGRSETRFHLDVQDLSQQLPGALTLAQLREDPTQADPRNIPIDARSEVQQYRAAVQHTVLSASGQRLDVGAYYQVIDFLSVGRFGITAGYDRDIGLSLRHEWTAQAMGATGTPARLVSGGRLAYGPSDSGRYAIGSAGERGDRTSTREDNPLALELFTEYQHPLSSRFTGVAGVSAVYARRDSRNTVLSGFGTSIDASEDFFGLNPKLGFLWQVADGVEVFGNLSRSFELPDDFEYANAFQDGTVHEQSATTLELGVRGRLGGFEWDAAAYRARVRDEILSQELPLGSGIYVTTNADRTVHSGVELGLGWTWSLGRSGVDTLQLRGAATWNDFRYDDDAVFGNNQLPGVPRHAGRAELTYQHANGFSFGPSVEVASAYYVDFANTLRAPSYAIWGLRAAYTAPSAVGPFAALTVFAEGRNLGDRHYVASTSITASADGMDTRIFNPGLTRSFFVGARLSF